MLKDKASYALTFYTSFRDNALLAKANHLIFALFMHCLHK